MMRASSSAGRPVPNSSVAALLPSFVSATWSPASTTTRSTRAPGLAKLALKRTSAEAPAASDAIVSSAPSTWSLTKHRTATLLSGTCPPLCTVAVKTALEPTTATVGARARSPLAMERSAGSGLKSTALRSSPAPLPPRSIARARIHTRPTRSSAGVQRQ